MRTSSYGQMAQEYVDAPRFDNNFAAISCWLMVAGFVVFPGTFTSLSHSEKIGETESGKQLQYVVANIPLLPVALACCLLGILGTFWMWRRWRNNYFWLSRQIFQ